jgi:hypothetical protein
MEPASVVLGVVGGAAALTALAIKTTKFLVELQHTHKDADLVIWDLRVACQALEVAWGGIRTWATDQCRKADNPGSIFEQFLSHLEYSKIAFDNLQTDLQRLGLSSRPTWRLSPKSKARVVVHEKMLRDHCDRLNRLINSVNLLLSTAKL